SRSPPLRRRSSARNVTKKRAPSDSTADARSADAEQPHPGFGPCGASSEPPPAPRPAVEVPLASPFVPAEELARAAPPPAPADDVAGLPPSVVGALIERSAQ